MVTVARSSYCTLPCFVRRDPMHDSSQESCHRFGPVMTACAARHGSMSFAYVGAGETRAMACQVSTEVFLDSEYSIDLELIEVVGFYCIFQPGEKPSDYFPMKQNATTKRASTCSLEGNTMNVFFSSRMNEFSNQHTLCFVYCYKVVNLCLPQVKPWFSRERIDVRVTYRWDPCTV